MSNNIYQKYVDGEIDIELRENSSKSGTCFECIFKTDELVNDTFCSLTEYISSENEEKFNEELLCGEYTVWKIVEDKRGKKE